MKNPKNKIFTFAALLLFIFLVTEVFFRIFFHIYFIKHPLPFKETDIKGVSYLMRNFSFDNYGIKHKPRIAILGDSISIHKDKNKKNYPELLDQKLSHSFEIINTGATFYSLPEEMSILRNKLLDYRPDIIVMGYVFNDLYLPNKYHALIPLSLKNDIYRFKIITPLAIKYLKVFFRVKRIYPRSYEFAPKFIQYFLGMHKDQFLTDLLKYELDELSRIQKEKGIQVIFLIVPIFYNFDDKGINYMNDFLLEECQKRNLDYINLLEVFKKNNYTAKQVKEDDGDIWHQNALGNEIIAGEVYKHIINNPNFKDLMNKYQGNQ